MRFWLRFFLYPWLLTVLIEECGALLWGFRRRELLTVLWVNTVTNLSVSALRYLSNQLLSSGMARTGVLAVLEAAVVVCEWLAFRHFLRQARHPFFLSLTLNAASFGAGFLLPVILRAVG